MKKYLTLAVTFFVAAMFLPACASNQTAATTRPSSGADSRVVNKVGRRNIPVTENRGSARIPGP